MDSDLWHGVGSLFFHGLSMCYAVHPDSDSHSQAHTPTHTHTHINTNSLTRESEDSLTRKSPCLSLTDSLTHSLTHSQAPQGVAETHLGIQHPYRGTFLIRTPLPPPGGMEAWAAAGPRAPLLDHAEWDGGAGCLLPLRERQVSPPALPFFFFCINLKPRVE